MSAINEKKVNIIVATDADFGIGKDGKLPWHLPKEMQFFKDTTSETFEFEKKNMVIMGRTTWESIDERFRPLKDRVNVVLSRNPDFKAEGATVCYSLGEALKLGEKDDVVETIFIIGGAEVYKQAIDIVDGVYITKLKKKFDCDVNFPSLEGQFEDAPESLGKEEEGDIEYEFFFYSRET